MKVKTPHMLLILVAALFFFGNLTASKAVVQNALHLAQEQARSGENNNELILAGASAFEDMAEAAFTGDKKGITLALQGYEKQAGLLGIMLPVQQLNVLREQVGNIRTATGQGNFAVVALQATGAYLTLTESLDRSNLSVPIEVALLDYAGFKFQALLLAKPIAWDSLLETVNQARSNWTLLKEKISDSKLAEAMDVAIEGMTSAQESRNTGMALLAARVDLALVDLLEASFEKTPGRK
ncbi:MAG TPA: hypothetical protein ENN06_12375 [Desulfobacteraceae bacterium]|nr:hypothetical protein [Desulfobacteraceae bacterium]